MQNILERKYAIEFKKNYHFYSKNFLVHLGSVKIATVVFVCI